MMLVLAFTEIAVSIGCLYIAWAQIGYVHSGLVREEAKPALRVEGKRFLDAAIASGMLAAGFAAMAALQG